MRVATRARTQSSKARWGARFAGAGVAAALAVGLAASPALAQPGPQYNAQVPPTETAPNTNPFCADIGLGSAVERVTGENPSGSGSLALPDGSTINYTIYPNPFAPPNGDLVDFSYSNGSTYAAAAVIVKGGPRANIYDYRTLPSGSISADETLHTSINDSNPNNPFYGISHIVFCSVKTNYT